MVKLLGKGEIRIKSIVALAVILLISTGCSNTEIITTFEDNYNNADAVSISYKADGDDVVLNKGDTVAFTDLETITALNMMNTDNNDELSYDEAYEEGSDLIRDLQDDMDTYKYKVSNEENDTVITFDLEGGVLLSGATGTETYTFSSDGKLLTFEQDYTYGDGTNDVYVYELTIQ